MRQYIGAKRSYSPSKPRLHAYQFTYLLYGIYTIHKPKMCLEASNERHPYEHSPLFPYDQNSCSILTFLTILLCSLTRIVSLDIGVISSIGTEI
jgi:hypothetical protein